jgi:hypothetical protein
MQAGHHEARLGLAEETMATAHRQEADTPVTYMSKILGGISTVVGFPCPTGAIADRFAV